MRAWEFRNKISEIKQNVQDVYKTKLGLRTQKKYDKVNLVI